jgi:hypothetical protein
MDDSKLDARAAASRARSLANIRRARETILNQISQTERLATRGDFEEMARRRLEAEHRELDDLAKREAALEAELRAAITPDTSDGLRRAKRGPWTS